MSEDLSPVVIGPRIFTDAGNLLSLRAVSSALFNRVISALPIVIDALRTYGGRDSSARSESSLSIIGIGFQAVNALTIE
jgi:hypothetical protein